MSGLPHGTIVERRRGQPVRAVERCGHEVWRAAWDGDRLARLEVYAPDRRQLVLAADGGEHPLFGPVHALRVGETVVAVCGAVDWAAPRWVPPISVPSALPPGSGAAILDFLARQAGETPLRYRGPYPTHALFDALLHSFAVDDPVKARESFTEGAVERAIAGAMLEVDVAFRPAPHEWIWPAPGVCVELRDGVERVFVHGRAYDRGTAQHRRVVWDGDAWAAVVTIADAPWHETLRVREDGVPIDVPQPIPAVASPLLGDALPDAVRDVLAEVLAARDGGPFAATLRSALQERRLVWGDTGDALAVGDAAEVRVHAVLGERIADLDAARVLDLLVDALEPVVRRLAVADFAPR